MSLRETIADVQHEIWAHWMRYLFQVSIKNPDGSYTIPADKVTRWMRQLETPYDKLTNQEQTSDREQADKVLAVLPPSYDKNGDSS